MTAHTGYGLPFIICFQMLYLDTAFYIKRLLMNDPES